MVIGSDFTLVRGGAARGPFRQALVTHPLGHRRSRRCGPAGSVRSGYRPGSNPAARIAASARVTIQRALTDHVLEPGFPTEPRERLLANAEDCAGLGAVNKHRLASERMIAVALTRPSAVLRTPPSLHAALPRSCGFGGVEARPPSLVTQLAQ